MKSKRKKSSLSKIIMHTRIVAELILNKIIIIIH